MGELTSLIVGLVDTVISALTLLIIARALLSWFIQDTTNPIMNVLYSLTEPILQPIRSRLGGNMGMDLSPLIAIIALQVLGRLLQALLGG